MAPLSSELRRKCRYRLLSTITARQTYLEMLSTTL